MIIKENSNYPAPSKSHLRWFEEAFSIKFPSSYEEFILNSNGATPITDTFSVGNRTRTIERFFPLFDEPNDVGEIGWYDITVVMTQIGERLADDEDAIGSKIIPIALLYGGDFLCLDYRTSTETPTVVVWDHEKSEDFGPVTWSVANDFDSFLEMVREADD